METTRQSKVSKAILKELSRIFHKETHQFLGNILVTITKVRVSRDLSISKVYLSIFPAKDPASILLLINKKKKFLRSLLAKELRYQLRIIPELIFYLDDSAEYAEEIDRLLNK